MIEFTWKELIFLALAIISLALNIIQWQKKKTLYKPIKNALVGLFNDIMNKRIHYYGRQKALENPNISYTDLNSVKYDFSIFVQNTIIDLSCIREHIVAALKTMDISAEEIFNAANFGLTPGEIKQREEFLTRGRNSNQSYSQSLIDTKE